MVETKCRSPRQTVSVRNWKSVDTSTLCSDLKAAYSNFTVDNDLESAVYSYNSITTSVIDSHAPEKSRTITIRKDDDWYTSELAAEKRLRRKLERRYNRTKLVVDHQAYCAQRDKYNSLLNSTKAAYYKQEIESAENSKDLFRTCKKLLNRSSKSVLPSYECANELANRFVQYFGDKIKLIREDLETPSPSGTEQLDLSRIFEGEPLQNFRLLDVDEVKKYILAAPNKSCSLDPIPTSVLKQCIEATAPVFTLLVNASLECADFSPELKRAFITPLLKKAILDCEILKNYRPVSNLSFLSKLIERIVCTQLIDHLKLHNLYETFQSAYRTLHSTETALLRVQNDLLQAVDSHGGAILILLDLSAAFDTIDHAKLLDVLKSSFGIEDTALAWFESYLRERTQTVKLGTSTSDPHTLRYGVPQGSVLGPILFTMYTTPLGKLIKSHGLTFHLYADDTQLYLAFKPSEQSSIDNVKSRIEKCVEEIRSWMKLNLLKLNDDKTELIVITSRNSTSESLAISLQVGDELVKMKDEFPKNLGVIFNSTCNMKEHIDGLRKSINFNLYSLGKIRKSLDKSCTEKLVNCLITSKMDYCNSLMYGLPHNHLEPLQLCQNHAARIITLRRKHDHITPCLISLHWLPVQFRIEYKMLMFTYKAHNNLAPPYLCELIKPYVPGRPGLRSANQELLDPTAWRLKTFGRRSFQVAAPTLWAGLPLKLRCSKTLDIFKKDLKTFLFKKAFNLE